MKVFPDLTRGRKSCAKDEVCQVQSGEERRDVVGMQQIIGGRMVGKLGFANL